MREFLDFDFPAAARACDECPYQMLDRDHECRDHKGRDLCKLRKAEALFPETFRDWALNLTRVYNWHKAGYSLDGEGLSFQDWNALAVITRHYEIKDMEAMLPKTN